MVGCLSYLGTVASLALTWQKMGKRRGHLPEPSALSLPAPACLPRLGETGHTFCTENSRTVLIPCLLQRAQGQAAPNPAALP